MGNRDLGMDGFLIIIIELVMNSNKLLRVVTFKA